MKRLLLEQRTIDEVLGLLRRVPVCSSGNYVLCDGAGHIADVELTPEGFTLLEDQEKESMMELTTSWKEEGIIQGRLEESRNLVLRQLRRRLGTLPDGVCPRLNQLNVEEFEELGEALLDFTSLSDLQSWLNKHSAV